MSLPQASDLNYYKTSRSAPDTWLDKACEVIREAGGRIRGRGHGFEAPDDGPEREAYFVTFELAGDLYRSVWPVLPDDKDDGLAARRQAATALYHDLKARAVRQKFCGARPAYLDMLVLPDGRTAAQASTPELTEHFPKLLTSGNPG